MNIPFEHWKTCEWATKSIQAYKDIHFTNDTYECNLSKDELVDYLYKKGISANYNEPMELKQISKMKLEDLQRVYGNIQIIHNLVNIQQVKGSDLEIVETNKYDYLLTYSFPCQDLSPAGLKKGMSDSSTRSGMLWEVERILKECNELGNLPQILLMENVPAIHNSKNIKDFEKWIATLEELGYHNYYQDMIATDYGIPQTRKRCFMISKLDDKPFVFPKPFELKTKLKDLLEHGVEEKYYISDRMIKGMLATKFNVYKLENKMLDKDGSAKTILARFEGAPQLIEDEYKGTYQFAKSDNFMQGKDRFKPNKETSDTIQTNQKEAVVLEQQLKKELCNQLIENGIVQENDVIKHSYTSQILDGKKKCVEMHDVMPTMTTRVDCLGVVVKEDSLFTETQAKMFTEDGDIKRYINSDKVDKFNPGDGADISYPNGYNKGKRVQDQVSPTLAIASMSNIITKEPTLRIRKLTPREVFRLMGVRDEDFDHVCKNQSNASLYHLAGDSIVTNCLMEIFKVLFEQPKIDINELLKGL